MFPVDLVLVVTCTVRCKILCSTCVRFFMNIMSSAVESSNWPLVMGLAKFVLYSFSVPNRLGLTKLTMQKSAKELLCKQAFVATAKTHIPANCSAAGCQLKRCASSSWSGAWLESVGTVCSAADGPRRKLLNLGLRTARNCRSCHTRAEFYIPGSTSACRIKVLLIPAFSNLSSFWGLIIMPKHS